MANKVVDYIQSPYETNEYHGVENSFDFVKTLRILKEEIRSCKANNEKNHVGR